MATSSKRARVLCQNEITEIVMDSESDENYACEEMDEEQPGLSSRRSSITRPAAQIFLPAAQKMRIMLQMWQDNSHNPVCGHSVKSVCVECDVALCVERNCFMDYHTKDKL